MNGLDLFSGIGGISIALHDYVRPRIYCEIDPYCQAVLLSRMADESLPYAPIWDDVKTLQGQPYGGVIDIIYGGFPCQDISVAGSGKGLAGERSGLFFEIMRLATEIKPPFIFLENVPAITTRGGLDVVREITTLGYDSRWCTISASALGALHKRERWFLLAHTQGKRGKRTREDVWNAEGESQQQKHSCPLQKRQGREAWDWTTRKCWPYGTVSDWQEIVSSMGKLSNGIPNYVDRLRALGNAVVPKQAKEAFEILMGVNEPITVEI